MNGIKGADAMTFLILFAALVIGIFTGVFLFGEVLKLRKENGKKANTVIRLIAWCVVAVVVIAAILMIYAYAVLGFLCGILIGLGCDLYAPSQNKDAKE